MLLAIKNCRSLDASISEKAAETLKNLKKFSENVRIMAENGYLDPLLDDLIQGTPTIVERFVISIFIYYLTALSSLL